MTYSFLGWLIEVMLNLVLQRRLVSPGFVFGPFCPVYGFGGVIAALLLSPLSQNILAVFAFGVIITSVVEHTGHWLLEKLYSLKLWDYSYRKLNLNGRICMLNSLLFGILAVLVVYIVQPFVVNLTANLPRGFVIAIATGSASWFVFDVINSMFRTPRASHVIANVERLRQRRQNKS